MELKPGDVVMLRSGGHPITVVEINENTVECVWMGGDGALFREKLPVSALESAEPDDSGDEDDDPEDDEEDEDADNKSKVA